MNIRTTHYHIELVIRKSKAGSIFIPSDFREHGTDASIRQALARLTRGGMIQRLAKGIYYKPIHDPVLGTIRPNAEEIVKIIAEKEKIRIKPAGTYALHRLGLTTQVPTKLVYITDGGPRTLKFGKIQVKLKSVTPKKMSIKGKYSSLVIQAIDELGVESINDAMAKKMVLYLRYEDPIILKHDISLAPGKVSDYISKLLNSSTVTKKNG